MEKEELKEVIRESIEDIFCSSDEFSSLNRLHDKVDDLLKQKSIEDRFEDYLKMCDKFENYMKNIDKFNELVNEFKGLVARVRGEHAVFMKKNQTALAEYIRIMSES